MSSSRALSPPPAIPEKHWLLGSAYRLQRNPMAVLEEWIASYGEIFCIEAPLTKLVVAAHPDYAQQVLVERYPKYYKKSRAYAVLRILFGNGLVTSEGDFWRRQRKLAQPAFHRKRLDLIVQMMVDRTQLRLDTLRDAAATGSHLDMAPIFSQLTLEIISRSMFGADVEGLARHVGKHINLLNAYAIRMLRNPLLFLLPRRFPTPWNRPEVTALKALNQIVLQIIAARRQQKNSDGDDLLSMLLHACDEETGQGMTDAQLRDEDMTIFVPGHETTATAMCWILYLLSQHPEVEERLVAELDTRWPEEGLGLSSFSQFPYLRQVINEAMRVFPPIWSIGRMCTEHDDLGGYSIKPGVNIMIPVFHLQKSSKYWDQPDKFDPDRFSPNRSPAEDKLIYLPFGAGPRSCIGNNFALQELQIITSLFYRHFRFRLQPGFPVEPEPLITLRPKHGMMMQPIKR